MYLTVSEVSVSSVSTKFDVCTQMHSNLDKVELTLTLTVNNMANSVKARILKLYSNLQAVSIHVCG